MRAASGPRLPREDSPRRSSDRTITRQAGGKTPLKAFCRRPKNLRSQLCAWQKRTTIAADFAEFADAGGLARAPALLSSLAVVVLPPSHLRIVRHPRSLPLFVNRQLAWLGRQIDIRRDWRA